MANPVNWFEIPTKDLEKAIAFYSEVFGVSFEKMEMGPLNMAMIAGSDRETYGATGALVQADGYV
ncbi:MAG: VOC family protein, partial [Proteobacteria bacterium]|nr:VOC family protein [Pseudomonadota bacterium]